MRSFAAAVLAAFALTSAPAPAARSVPLDLPGARGFVRSDPGAMLAGVALVVKAGLDRQGERENGLAALVAEAVLRSPAALPGTPTPLADALDARGASLGYTVGRDEVRFYLEGTPAAIAAATPLVAGVLRAPAFDGATLAAARRALGERIGEDEGDPRLVGRALLRASYYRGAAGQPLGNAGSLAALTPAQAGAFFASWYRRGDAVAAAVGRTGPWTDTAGAALLGALSPGTAPPAEPAATKPFGAEPRRIVTQRDVGAPYVALGFAAPALGDPDFPAALVMRSLLGSVFDRASATTRPLVFRSVGVLYDYDASPGQLVLWINGAQIEPDVGLSAIDTVVRGAAAKPLSANVLARYKESARGEWTLETVPLDRRAFAIASAAARRLDPDAADEVAAAIARVTAADVQRAAKKYFRKFDVALIMPRSGGS